MEIRSQAPLSWQFIRSQAPQVRKSGLHIPTRKKSWVPPPGSVFTMVRPLSSKNISWTFLWWTPTTKFVCVYIDTLDFNRGIQFVSNNKDLLYQPTIWNVWSKKNKLGEINGLKVNMVIPLSLKIFHANMSYSEPHHIFSLSPLILLWNLKEYFMILTTSFYGMNQKI